MLNQRECGTRGHLPVAAAASASACGGAFITRVVGWLVKPAGQAQQTGKASLLKHAEEKGLHNGSYGVQKRDEWRLKEAHGAKTRSQWFVARQINSGEESSSAISAVILPASVHPLMAGMNV